VLKYLNINHNPKVGGSSPSPATNKSEAHIETVEDLWLAIQLADPAAGQKKSLAAGPLPHSALIKVDEIV
jgi:hypothetical protein